MSGFPTGVAVVTTTDADGLPRGMTCSSVCSVALDPPTLLICVRHGSPTLDALLRRSAFAVNLLHEGARTTAELFASGAADRFDHVEWTSPRGGGGPHLPGDAHATADCRVSRTSVVGDHTVVFGEVFRVSQRAAEPPLLYGLRRYAAWPVG
jgi:flavin reductase (DIM6/NTAB) family NADH-FMN oxidoreductase RutF